MTGRHGLALAVCALSAISASASILHSAPASARQPAPETRVVNIVAERFTFTPAKITVDQGTHLEIRLTSDDTAHGFRLIGPGNINVEIPKRGRGEVKVMFDADTPGKYVFECSQICGAGHDFMRGTIEVKSR